MSYLTFYFPGPDSKPLRDELNRIAGGLGYQPGYHRKSSMTGAAREMLAGLASGECAIFRLQDDLEYDGGAVAELRDLAATLHPQTADLLNRVLAAIAEAGERFWSE